MEDDKDIAAYYRTTTAKYCSALASTLALHPIASCSQWNSLLLWTESSTNPNYAIADGELRFRDDRIEDREAIVECMESKIRPIYEEMREARSSLATWEMKSPRAGPVEVMTAVRNLGKFSWTYCNVPNCPNCIKQNKHVKAMNQVEEVIVGHDAPTPPWKLPKYSSEDLESDIDPLASGSHSDATFTQSPKVPDDNHDEQEAASTRQRPVTRSTTSKAALSSRHASPTKVKGKKRKRDEEDDEASSSQQRPLAVTRLSSKHVSSTKDKTKDKDKKHEDTQASSTRLAQRPITRSTRASALSSIHASPGKSKGKKRKQGDESDEDYEDKYGASARMLVQQAWAQAVRIDGTLIVLHSGNYELVCVRDRRSQTHYVSDVIKPPTYPGYGKLHIGIYIAAIQETIDRKKLLLQSNPPGDDSIGGDEDNQEDHNYNQGSGSRHKDGRRPRGGDHGGHRVGRSQFQGSAGRSESGPTDGLVEKAIDVANILDVVLLYIQYDIYDSPIPASFYRSASSITVHQKISESPRFSSSSQDIHICRLEECITIVLTSGIGRGTTGADRAAHRGTLTCKADGAISLDVVVKLAFDVEQRDTLRNEYEVYRHLRLKGVHQGITRALGFFDDSEDTACALVTIYAGVPISAASQSKLSISECKSALSTLQSIHDAGILHGDIRRENILIGDSGITIIDFGHSEHSANQKAKDKELSQLYYFLGLVGNEYINDSEFSVFV